MHTKVELSRHRIGQIPLSPRAIGPLALHPATSRKTHSAPAQARKESRSPKRSESEHCATSRIEPAGIRSRTTSAFGTDWSRPCRIARKQKPTKKPPGAKALASGVSDVARRTMVQTQPTLDRPAHRGSVGALAKRSKSNTAMPHMHESKRRSLHPSTATWPHRLG